MYGREKLTREEDLWRHIPARQIFAVAARDRSVSSSSTAGACNGAGVDDKSLEHEPQPSLCQATARSYFY